MSQLIEKPITEHLNAVKHILRYIAGTITYDCHYKHGVKELKLLRYNDADMGSDINTSNSTTSLVFYLRSSTMTW
jgi:hypothetical protein